MLKQRKLSVLDRLISGFAGLLNQDTNNYPAKQSSCRLSVSEKKTSAKLMRVNHAGEVSAQALYLGQALTARSVTLTNMLLDGATAEQQHLLWCRRRLSELGSRTSILSPLWFAGSFVIGAIAGLAGDKYSLGFLAETENQVSKHLESHLNKLPDNDIASKQILSQMLVDEQKHEKTAIENGGEQLPSPIPSIMRYAAKAMTHSAKYV